ncbi:hypothetical protein QKT49_gp352 [Acanthamoeba castellanii medusavirus]|uniref:Uncharacterized protein n=1 Tax=Acanthamoeba castellanii medusavirus J1 TaxID=3114988 RepID=A0A3T1CX59_9VIRU|nr:hypothetical protein QKT49_gp352 [Acanthamoeba castellanii medusavirus]BBI30411.1 hypothetical protein [Acanthamoeba castellanii medusavirus J1]
MAQLRKHEYEQRRALAARSAEYRESRDKIKGGTQIAISPEIFERVVMWNGVIEGDVVIQLAEPAPDLVMHSKVLRASAYFEAALSWQARNGGHATIDLTNHVPMHVHYLLYCLYFPKRHFDVQRCPVPFWEGLQIPIGELPAFRACSSYLQIDATAGVRVKPNSLPTLELPRGTLDTAEMSVWLDYAGFHPEDEEKLVFDASEAIVAWLNSLVGLGDLFERLHVECKYDDVDESYPRSYTLDFGNGFVHSGRCVCAVDLTAIVKNFLNDKDVWPRFV